MNTPIWARSGALRRQEAGGAAELLHDGDPTWQTRMLSCQWTASLRSGHLATRDRRGRGPAREPPALLIAAHGCHSSA